MIELAYKLSDAPESGVFDHNLTKFDETELRYHFFFGDQIILVDGVDFSARWGWVPLLDFAACLVAIVSALSTGEGAQVFEFTESDACLWFERVERDVMLRSNYCDARATVPLTELEQAAWKYAESIVEDAKKRCPQLAADPTLINWYPRRDVRV